MDIPKDDDLHVLAPQFGGIHVVELLLLQGGKEALHAGVVIAATGAAHALHDLVAPERLAEQLAGELTAPIRVKDQTLCVDAAAGILQGLDTQLRLHIVIHMEALNAAIEAVQHRCQIELAVRAGDLGDVCQELFVWFCGRKIPLDQVFRLLRLPVHLCETVGAVLAMDGQVMLPADAVDPPGATGVASMQSEPGNDPPDPVVFAVFLVLPQTVVDLLQKLTVPQAPLRTPQKAVVPLFTDMQHPAHGRHRPAAQMCLDKPMLAAGAYGFRRLAKKPSASCKISTSCRACCSCARS